MKIIDNPALGIGLLLCIGLVVVGLAIMTSAEGQFYSYSRAPAMVTLDDGTPVVFSSMTSSDDDSPFLPRDAPSLRPQEVAQADRARVEQARAQNSAAQQSQRQQNTVRIEGAPVVLPRTENQSADPFAAPPREQQRVQLSGMERRVVDNPLAAPPRQQVTQAQKRDELLFRIVKLRLNRGEFEQLVPVAMQMQNPERVVEMMLDMAEETPNKEIVAKLLDVATIVLLHLGQPRPPVPGMMGMPGMPGGTGMPGMMPPVQPMPGQPMSGMPTPGVPGQPMPMGGMMPGTVSFGTGMPSPPNSGPINVGNSR